MSTQLKLGLLFFSIIVVIATTTITIIHSQKKDGTISLRQQTIDQDDVPIANYNGPLPADLKERDKRQKRSKRRNMKLGPDTGVRDPKRFMITEERESSFGSFETHAPVEPAIPAAKSNVVITGEITKSEAFLTEDKTSIYSEFTVNVNSILKNSTSEVIHIGDSIIISRNGGAVRFSSGKVYKTLFDGKPMPHIGSKYILFLSYEAEGKDYPIITGYELKDGKILPLDGLERDGRVVHELTSHQSYKGVSETDFLNLVQIAVNNSLDIFEREGQ